MKRPLILLGVAALLVTAGCGADKTKQNNQYVDQVNAAQQRFARSISGLDTAARSPKAISAGILNLRAAIVTTAGEIRTIKPPPKAVAAHDRLVAFLGAYAGSLRRAAKGVTSRFPAKAAKAAQALVAATRRAQAQFDAAITDVNQRLRR